LGWPWPPRPWRPTKSQLIESINAYRSQPQRCGGQASLNCRCRPTRLALPATGTADLQQAMASASYPMVNVQAISLSGPRDAASAMKGDTGELLPGGAGPAVRRCRRQPEGRDWRIVLARPLLSGKTGGLAE
jgi:hypothetical protein